MASRGEEIPLAARVFAVADVLDALTTDRPYRPASPFAEAREMIVAESGKQFDPRVIEAFNSIADETFERIAGRDPVSRGVLVVDDDPFIRKLIATTLEDVAEFELHEAADGLEALEVAAREHPTLVFLDVDMPALNGIDACRRLREDEGNERDDDRDADRRSRRRRRAPGRGGRSRPVPDQAVQSARPAAARRSAERAAMKVGAPDRLS